MTTLQEVEAYNYCQETLALKSNIERAYLGICARLHKIKKERLYEANFGSWELFLEEMRVDKGSAERMVRIYETFILSLGIQEELVQNAGGWSVVAELLPIAKTKEDAEEGLEFASKATKKDVRMYVREKLGIAPSALCEHKDTYTVRVCRDCGERWEDYKD